MNPWITYIRERFPVLTFSVLAAGISLSGIYLAGGVFSWLPFVVSLIGICLAFFVMRLMDDYKDLGKDRIAYPDRALPRGLLKASAVLGVLNVLQMTLFVYGMVVWVILQEAAALAYVCVALYIWLMYKDFYLGQWIVRHPFLHRLLEQFFVFPLAFFAIAVSQPATILHYAAWAFAAMLAGAFFCYEICRKLDPHAHPIIGSLVHFFGFRRAYEVAALALAISAMSASVLNLTWILFPCEFFVLITLSLLFFQPRWFKVPEVAAGLSLMLHAWAVVLYHYGIS